MISPVIRNWRKTFSLSLLSLNLALCLAGESSVRADAARTLGLLVGGSFPKFLFAAVQVNLFQHWALDYEASIGIFWDHPAVRRLLLFFEKWMESFRRGGLSKLELHRLIQFDQLRRRHLGTGSQGGAVTIPVGLLYMSGQWFCVEY